MEMTTLGSQRSFAAILFDDSSADKLANSFATTNDRFGRGSSRFLSSFRHVIERHGIGNERRTSSHPFCMGWKGVRGIG
ncbi:MAG: hypothetical protein AAGA71_22090 [Pseudomonadota bacterium]